MQDLKVDANLGKKIYTAVSKFGQSAWDNNVRLKKRGERRILREFPPDPSITWKEWKKRPGVFLDQVKK
jgi:hypothetical protein